MLYPYTSLILPLVPTMDYQHYSFDPDKSALPTNPPTGSAIILTNMKVPTLRVAKLITGSII